MSHRPGTPRLLTALVAWAVIASFVPAAGVAGAQEPPPACPEEVPAAPFTDVASIPTAHRSNVACAAFHGIVTGFTDGTYRPALHVRRDQIAAFIARTLSAADIPLAEPDGGPFTDLAGNVHADDINRLAASDIAFGLTATTFGPAEPVRRDQIASFLLRAMAFAEGVDLAELQSSTAHFTDVDAANVHSLNVNGAAELGLAQGRTSTIYDPSSRTRRDQMASFVVRLLADVVAGAPPDGPVLTVGIAPTGCIVGDALTATATLTVEGDGVAGEDVQFSTSGAGTSPETATVETDDTGQATFPFILVEPGTATVTASFEGNGQEATATAQVTCGDTGVIVDVAAEQEFYVYVPDGRDGSDLVGYGGAGHTFSIDGSAAAASAFTAALSAGDRITWTDDDGLHHALVNVDPPDEGVVGNVLTSVSGPFGRTYAVIDPTTGTQLSGYISYESTCDLLRIDGSPASLDAFESDLSEGDVLERTQADGIETCNVNNETVTGTVQDSEVDPAAAALFRIDGFGDSFDDAAAAAGPLATTDFFFLVDAGYPDQTFTVDGLEATQAEFVGALSDGDQATYSRAAGAETFTLVNVGS